MHSIQMHAAPDVFEVKVPFENVSTSATNCFVVIDGGEALVVDTGAPTDEGAAVLEAALDELGVDRRRATFFLTHLHLDHAGLVDAVVPAGARVCASEVDFAAVRATRAAAYFEETRRLFEREGLSFTDASGFARYAIEPQLFDPERIDLAFVGEGDELRVGRYVLRVVETPGHTPGHLSLFESSSGILFGGDHVLFVISPSIALFPDGTDGLQAYLDSLDKVGALGCKRLLVSHGEPRDDFAERVDWLAEHHVARLREAAAIVAAEPGLTGEQVIRRIRWNVPHDRWEDISFVQRWCIVTEGIVILDHLADRALVRRELDDRGVWRYAP